MPRKAMSEMELKQLKLFDIIYDILVKQGKNAYEAFASAVVLSSDESFAWVLENRRSELEGLLEFRDEV